MTSAIRRPAFVGIVVFAATALLYATWIGVRFGFNHPPSSTGDELSYDSMAWELSHGRGFAMNVHDAEFRRPYHVAAVANPELYAIPAGPAGPIAFRPPLFSLLFAATNVVAGRQFYLIRAFNVACIAATAGLLAWFLIREIGPLPTGLIILLFLIDVRPRLYARTLLTEPLACLLCTLISVGLLNVQRAGRLTGRNIVCLGIMTGLSVLTRSIVVAWLPGLLLLLIAIQRGSLQSFWQKCKSSLLVIGVAATVTLPWCIRNVTILERFSPTGTQGQMELSAGYSDAAWKHFGVWQNLAARGNYEHVVEANMTPLQRELAVADESTRRAKDWIRANPSRLPLLAGMKIISELKPRTVVETILLVLIATAIFFGRNRGQIVVLSGLIGVNLLAVGVTWSVEGRFLVPQLFAFYAIAGLGLGGLLKRTSDRTEVDAKSDMANTNA